MLALVLVATQAFAAPKTLRFEEGEVVRAKIQKPEIEILITRRDLTPRYELELKESFLPLIEASVEKKPF